MSGMHLVRGMTTTNSRKRKVKRKPGWQKAQQEHEAFLKKMGISDNKKSDYRYAIPSYKSEDNTPKTSDKICGNGTRKEAQKYTGDEIAGIVVTHKSNLMPVRKDNKQAAVDAANMRR